jgi:hypothetical protein
VFLKYTASVFFGGVIYKNIGPWMFSSEVFGLFWNEKDKKVKTRLQERVYLQIAYFNVADYCFDNVYEDVFLFPNSALRVSLRIVPRAEKFQACNGLTNTCCTSTTSLTAMAFMVVLTWLRKHRPSGFSCCGFAGCSPKTKRLKTHVYIDMSFLTEHA